MENKIRYSDEELKEFEQLLLKKQNETIQQIESFNKQLLEIAENGKDENSLDNTSYEAQIDFLVSYRDRNEKYLDSLDKALYRIKNKTYGVCVITGKLIDKNRLKAVPTTTKSIEAKTQNIKIKEDE
jgi:RNA polymerase-binding protein DksA